MAIPTIFDALAKAIADANAKAKATATAPVTTPAKTTTTAPKTSTPSLIQDIKTSQATGKSLLQVIKERQATPTKTVTTTTEAKTTTVTPSNIVTSPLNPFEQLIGKTNPALAQKMYESRTGKTVTAPITEPSSGRIGLTDTATPTTGTNVVTPPAVTPGIQSNLFYNPLESFIAKVNPQMARNMFESRVEKNKFNETDITNQAQSDIKGSIAYKFNVPVNDYDYTTESNRLSSDITSAEANIQSNWTWLKNYNSYERGINNNISTIQSGPSDAKWEIDINQDNKIDPDTEVFTPSQAIDYFKGELSSAKLTKQNVEANITLLDSDIKSMKKSKIYLEEYQRKGYYLDVKNGEYYFSEPKASEVVEKVYGDRPDLYIASELRTLGFGVLLAGGQDLISGGGTKSLEANREATAESILGATRLEGESIQSHAVRFWTSGEAIMDVWVPVATLGLSKALTVGGRLVAPKLISWGSKLLSEAGPTTKTIVAGAKTVGAVGGKILSEPVAQYGMKYGMYGMMEAPNLISIAQERPEMFGSTLGKSLYRWEVTWGAMDLGTGGITRGKPKIEYTAQDIEDLMKTAKVTGDMNYVVAPRDLVGPAPHGTPDFSVTGIGEYTVAFEKQKPITVYASLDAKGNTFSDLIKGTDLSMSQGTVGYRTFKNTLLNKGERFEIQPITGSDFIYARRGEEIFAYQEGEVGRNIYLDSDVSSSIRRGEVLTPEEYLAQEVRAGNLKVNYYSDLARETKTLGSLNPSKQEINMQAYLPRTKLGSYIRSGGRKTPGLYPGGKYSVYDTSEYIASQKQSVLKHEIGHYWQQEQVFGGSAKDMMEFYRTEKGFYALETDAEFNVLETIGYTKKGQRVTTSDLIDYAGLEKGREPISGKGSTVMKKVEDTDLYTTYHYKETSTSSDIIGGVRSEEQATGHILVMKKADQIGVASLETDAELMSLTEQEFKGTGVSGLITKQKAVEVASRQLEYVPEFQMETILTPAGQTTKKTLTGAYNQLVGPTPSQERMSQKTSLTTVGTTSLTLLGATELETGLDTETEQHVYTSGFKGDLLSNEPLSKTDVDLGINLGLETGSELAQTSRLDQESLTRTEQSTELISEQPLLSPTPIFVPGNIHIPRPRFPRRPKQEDEEEKYFKPVKRQKQLIKSTSRRRAKGLMADLLSVTQSQARYGKSTQPKLTTKLWKESEKSLFKRVPTQELMKGGRTKADNLIGNKKKGGKKNVYY